VHPKQSRYAQPSLLVWAKSLSPLHPRALWASDLRTSPSVAAEPRQGSQLFTENTPLGERAKIAFGHVAGAYIPGAAEMFVQEKGGSFVQGRVTRAVTGKPSATGQEFDRYEEGAAVITGLRPLRAQLDQTFKYKGFEYNQARRDASSVFSRVANANDSTEEQVIEASKRLTLSSSGGRHSCLIWLRQPVASV